jgi:glucosamine kinase
MSESPIYAGIDGGGTRSELVLMDADHTVIRRIQGGSLQVLRLSEAELAANLQALAEQLTDSEQARLKTLGAGLAGAHAAKTRDRIQPLLEKAFALPASHVELRSDIEMAHIGAFQDTDGLMLIFGTGSVALWRRGETWRIYGGYGYQIGDEASGYDLGRHVLRLISLHLDEAESHPQLFDRLAEQLEDPSVLANRDAFIRWIYEDRPDPARFAPLLLDLAEQNEAYRALLENRIEAFMDHLQSLTAIIPTLTADQWNICFAGGLTQHDFYKSLIRKRLLAVDQRATFIPPRCDAAQGAALAAKHQNH